MALRPHQNHERLRPFGRVTPREIYPLALEQVRPVIRIAHRLSGSLRIMERIIFDYELVLVLAGQGTVRFGAETISFGPHDLFCIPPFVPHAIESAVGQRCEHVAVHFDWAPGLPPSGNLDGRRAYEVRLPGGAALPRHVRLLARDRIASELSRVVDAFSSESTLDELEATACLMHVLSALLRRERTSQDAVSVRDRARMEEVLALIDQRLGSDAGCRPEQLARAVGLSPSHFNRLFREWTGFALFQYQRRLRVARARELLADPKLSIKEIAARCGFDDPYHFSRVFRQIDGLSPSQYREARLAGKTRSR